MNNKEGAITRAKVVEKGFLEEKTAVKADRKRMRERSATKGGEVRTGARGRSTEPRELMDTTCPCSFSLFSLIVQY